MLQVSSDWVSLLLFSATSASVRCYDVIFYFYPSSKFPLQYMRVIRGSIDIVVSLPMSTSLGCLLLARKLTVVSEIYPHFNLESRDIACTK